jgi:hypothetical protein
MKWQDAFNWIWNVLQFAGRHRNSCPSKVNMPMLFASYVRIFAMPAPKNAISTT